MFKVGQIVKVPFLDDKKYMIKGFMDNNKKVELIDCDNPNYWCILNTYEIEELEEDKNV